ncbi:MAG: Dihydrolipoamide dehydrogenase [Candidatus Alkanophagales archaeon MCA70_species_1]|nr:Dihydrolipoamide dehydrogenase [Candidatus Alkanophaga volatiphilum]
MSFLIPEEVAALFEPIKIGDVELRSRIVMAPMGTGFATRDGFVTDRMIAYYAERAKGGAGMITVEASCVDSPVGRLGPHDILVDDDKFIPGLSKLAEAIKKEGAVASLQLAHGGRYSRSYITGTQPVAPSPIPSRYTKETPRELTTEEVEAIIDKFADAALRAKRAGFDAVELMGSTGYLISQFLSSLTNKRTDRFGGDAAARATFAVEIIQRIREKVGSQFPISFKFSVNEYLPGGNTIEDSKIIARRVEEAGASIIHAWAGWHESPVPMLPMSVERGAFVHLAEAMKEVVSIPVIAVGRINDVKLAARIIREKRADLVAMGRAFLADPHFPNKAKEGRFDEIRMCIGCCRCFDNVMRALADPRSEATITCSLNAEVGREFELAEKLKRAEKPKKVLIVGGGPAGMETARVLKLRGHEVKILEEDEKLGGNLLLAAVPPYKSEINNIIQYLTTQMRKLGVAVETSRKVTADEVLRLMKEDGYDELVIAVGASPIIPEVSGVAERLGKSVFTAVDVLAGRVPEDKIGEGVVVVGGGMIGCETAEFLAAKGRNVTIVEMKRRIAEDIGPTTRWVVVKRLRETPNIQIMTSTRLEGVTDRGVIVEVEAGAEAGSGSRERREIEAATVVLAVGMRRNEELQNALRDKVKFVEIGDCVEPRKILEAIHDGWRVGCEL